MSDLASRLASCFAVVFPALTPQEIPKASLTFVGSWDSLASATLIATIEEEFSIQVVLDDLEHFVSFELILNYLEASESRRNAGSEA